jgi:hypothetical protein
MPTLYLCGGLQSSGSTLVSWCFLQRSDMNGVLDAYNDVLPWFDPQGRTDLLWCKTTIGCFRLIEVIQHFQDCGWNVPPLLIVRDVRKVWASLVGKSYGLNGLTAEDPPLRLRFRRFLSDWELFRDEKWPILRYESLVADPESTLRQACQDLALPWDDGMVRWPKAPQDIACTENGNRTFWTTRGNGLRETIDSHVEHFKPQVVATDDWEWLEEVFGEFNSVNHYPLIMEVPATGYDRPTRFIPRFDVTRRSKWELQARPILRFLSLVGFSSPNAVDQRARRKAA